MRAAWIHAAAQAIALCVSLAGCSRRAEPPPRAQPESPAPAGPITLRTVDATEFASTLARYRGRAVLVDYWATWCEPCKRLFPHTVSLYRELADHGLAVVAVSFDDAEDEPAAREFLAAQGAMFENFRAEPGASQRSFIEFDVPNGTLPFLRLYDRAGKLDKEFFAPIKPDEIERAVKELLAAA